MKRDGISRDQTTDLQWLNYSSLETTSKHGHSAMHCKLVKMKEKTKVDLWSWFFKVQSFNVSSQLVQRKDLVERRTSDTVFPF